MNFCGIEGVFIFGELHRSGHFEDKETADFLIGNQPIVKSDPQSAGTTFSPSPKALNIFGNGTIDGSASIAGPILGSEGWHLWIESGRYHETA